MINVVGVPNVISRDSIAIGTFTYILSNMRYAYKYIAEAATDKFYHNKLSN